MAVTLRLLPVLLGTLAFPVEARSQTEPRLRDEWYLTTSDQCRLYIAEYGDGKEPVIVLHGGWGAEHGYLVGALQGLDSEFRFILYDQRGSLRSPCPESSFSVERMVQDLDELRGALGLEKSVLLGHSMGSYLALAYLARHPDRVRGLVLTGAVQPQAIRSAEAGAIWLEQLRSDSLAQTFFTRPEVVALLQAEGLMGNERTLGPRDQSHLWRIRDFAAVNIVHLEHWRELRGGKAFYNPAVGRAIARHRAPSDFRPDLRRRPCATAVIIGDHDFVDMGGTMWQRQAREVGNIALTIIPDAGHIAWIDQPDRFREAVQQALRQQTSCP
jgi:pimeloyl-ACP methyl ester carboxylesterase